MSTNKYDKSFRLLIKDLMDYGDLLLIANKGTGKTNNLMCLAHMVKCTSTRVIVFEDFPKWCLEFSKVPYLVIEDQDVVETKKAIDIDNVFLTHSKDYTVMNGTEIRSFLNTNKDCIFTMDLADTDRAAFFVYSIIQYFYRKAYQRKLDGVKKLERIVFVIEESQNVFDSSVIAKKVFNRLRKIFAIARNLGLHFILASQRLQDINTKIRGRCRLMLGNVSVDDWELKVKRLLKSSKYQEAILNFPRGKFVHAPTDTTYQFPKFKAVGKPYRWSLDEAVASYTKVEMQVEKLAI